jgi:hypothetical protein
MHTARQAVAWAAWTCNTGIAGCSQKRAGFGPLFFRAPGRRIVHSWRWIVVNRQSRIVGESQEIDWTRYRSPSWICRCKCNGERREAAREIGCYLM